DDIFWMEAYGDKKEILSKYKDPYLNKYIKINYGPWERLNGNKPFIDEVGEKPAGANFYPPDMTKDEFEKLNSEDKTSLYTLIIRDEKGKLQSVPYHIAFKEKIDKAAELLLKASELTDDADLKKYLRLRSEALLTDEYFESDLAWMDMKNNNIDFVVGPIENYEDGLYGYKAAHESYVLLKDKDWSDKLARFALLLSELQKSLPVEDEYKQEVPGSDSDLGVYDAVYYAGDCNAGSKTIAINLPNDERVHIEKGSRKLQLKNSMKAKFDKILIPISDIVIAEEQQKHIKFDAFFENVMFHETSHGLGIKNTVNGKGTVRDNLMESHNSIEEAKADIGGLFLVSKLHEMGELGDKDLMDNYVTFMAGIFRSVRFGASSAHGKSNMIQFNYFIEKGAFNRDNNGFYSVNFEVMREAVSSLLNEILVIQGDGNYEAAKKLLEEKGIIKEDLQKDIQKIADADIPKDIVFNQGLKFLDLK
ncbi:MAG: Zn-dependent hydrolase, partial [Bacteroidales bacterium]|nr:Zn-dependent hydrolase [Bacteroidales bacterium]